MERLPDGLPPHTGNTGEGERAPQIVGVGDSVIAGVGVEYLSQSLTAKVAEQLAMELECSVQWAAYGCNGDRARELVDRIGGIPAGNVDAVIVSIGVNDVSGLTSITRWQFQIATLIAGLRQCFQAPIVFMGVPPMGKFPGLPQPLRFALGVRAAMLDIMLKHSADVVPGIYWVSSSIEGAQVASDGYHPGEVACEMVAVDIVEKCLAKELILAHEP